MYTLSLRPSEKSGARPPAPAFDCDARTPAQAFLLAGRFAVVSDRAFHLGKTLADVPADQAVRSLGSEGSLLPTDHLTSRVWMPSYAKTTKICAAITAGTPGALAVTESHEKPRIL